MESKIKWFEDVSKTDRCLIEAFENKYEIKLPDDYCEFALKFSGGLTENNNEFMFILDGREFCSSIGYFLSFALNEDIDEDTDNIYWALACVEGLPDKFIPICNCSGSGFVGYDYKFDEPKISYWMFGIEKEIMIADNFTSFLTMLYEHE